MSAREPERQLLDLLGLAARAGALLTGTAAVRQGVRDGEVRTVLLAADASPTQQQKLLPLLEARGVPLRALASRARFGAALGRGPVSAVGICNENFARRIAELASVVTSSADQHRR